MMKVDAMSEQAPMLFYWIIYDSLYTQWSFLFLLKKTNKKKLDTP